MKAIRAPIHTEDPFDIAARRTYWYPAWTDADRCGWFGTSVSAESGSVDR
jgi:hypothetical protein